MSETITFSKFVDEVSVYMENSANIPFSATHQAAAVLVQEIGKTLECGHRAEFRGLGSFSVKSFAARAGRNPSTGAKITLKPKCKVSFKPGLMLRKRIDKAC